MTRGHKVLVAGAAAIALVGAGVAWYLGPIAPIATGYAAKIQCSGVFVASRSLDHTAGDLPDNPLVPLLRTTVDPDEGRVTTTLLGLWGSTAYATDGLGCTLADARPTFTSPAAVAAPDLETPWPEGNGPPQPPEGVEPAVLEAAIGSAFTEDDPDGRLRNSRAVVVIHDGQLLAERYGDGFDADTPLLGWSMSKSIANAMIGRLVAAGDLALDEAVLRPAWVGDDRAGITYEHLLTMTSGLAFEEVYDPDTDATRMLFRPGSTGLYAADQPLVADPGTVWDYSSGTTNLLCDALHDASGLGPEMAHELVFGPLGMASAVMEPDASGGLVCSSYTYATARDWGRFGQWFLQDGVWEGERLLPDGWVAGATTPVELAPSETPYGRHWWLNQAPDGQRRMPSVPADAYWASGNEGQQVAIVPSRDLVVVRLGFSGAFSGIDWGLEPLLAGVIEALP